MRVYEEIQHMVGQRASMLLKTMQSFCSETHYVQQTNTHNCTTVEHEGFTNLSKTSLHESRMSDSNIPQQCQHNISITLHTCRPILTKHTHTFAFTFSLAH